MKICQWQPARTTEHPTANLTYMKALETNTVHFSSSCFLRIKGTIFRIGVVTTGKSHGRSFQHLHLLYLSSSLTPCAVPFYLWYQGSDLQALPSCPLIPALSQSGSASSSQQTLGCSLHRLHHCPELLSWNLKAGREKDTGRPLRKSVRRKESRAGHQAPGPAPQAMGSPLSLFLHPPQLRSLKLLTPEIGMPFSQG